MQHVLRDMAALRQLHCNCQCNIGMKFCDASFLVCPNLHVLSHVYQFVCLVACMCRQ